jgi:capsular polysaccharide biosynthesis protein
MTLQELLKVLHDHLLFVILLPLMSALVIGVVSFVLPNQYTASTTVYVLAKSSNTSTSSTSSDLTASQMITNDIATLIQSSNVSSSTASQLGLENLNGYSIKTTSSTTTRILTISVTGPNAQTAANIANTIVSVTSGISQNVMDVQSVNAIDSAVAPATPSGPNHLLYTLVALIAGLFVAIAVCVLMETLNTKARSSEDVEELLGVPVIGHIPAVGER